MISFIPVFVGYGIACALHLAYLTKPRPVLAAWARYAMVLAVALHAVSIGLRCVQGFHPVASPAEALSLVAWLLGAAFAAVSFRYPVTVVGAFVAPVSLCLWTLARLTPAGQGASAAPEIGTLGRVHITLSIAGISLFALAAALAAIYLVAEAQLKAKKVGVLVQQGTPLATLDALGYRCVSIGFPLFTVALVTGAMWVARLSHPSRLALRPEYLLSIVAWLFFGVLLVARMRAGWQGRRAAWLTLAGFGGTLATLLVYLVRYAAGG